MKKTKNDENSFKEFIVEQALESAGLGGSVIAVIVVITLTVEVLFFATTFL